MSHASDAQSVPAPVVASKMIPITYMVPADKEQYTKIVHSFMDIGMAESQKQAKALPFIKKTVEVAVSTDVMRASAEAAAHEFGNYGKPENKRILYLKVKGKTAYVLLDIDRDGWAGVSYTIGLIHPLVEKTLLQFKNIEQVVFDEAPGEPRLYDR